MKHFKINLYEYFGFKKKGKGGILTTYIPDDVEWLNKKIRPAMLVIPGGAYISCAEREKEPVALKFMANGFAAFTLEYSTLTTYPVPLFEAMMAIKYLRDNQTELGINKIAVTGFSAGGHLAGMLATTLEEEMLELNINFALPDAAILCYPVVTLKDEFTHLDTRKNITGNDESLYEKLSIENRVKENSSPVFIWHTVDDDVVPVENSLLLASAYRKLKVPFSLHIFEKGWHGLSLANRETSNDTKEDHELEYVGKWFDLALDFLINHGFNIDIKRM